MPFDSRLSDLGNIGVSASQIYVTSGTGDVTHMGGGFLGVFGEIIRLSLGFAHEEQLL